MPTDYYVANSTRKEYIWCPYGCRIYNGSLLSKDCCLSDLVFYALYNQWNSNDKIKIYHDAGAPCPKGKCNDTDHLPWWCTKQEYKNIAPDLINQIGDHRLKHWKDRKKNECICQDDALDNKVHEDAMKWFGDRVLVKDSND